MKLGTGTMAQGEVSEMAINVLATAVIMRFDGAARIRVVDVQRAAKNDVGLSTAMRNLWPDGKMPTEGAPGRRITFALIRAAGRDFCGKTIEYTPAGDQAYAIFRVVKFAKIEPIEPTPPVRAVQLEINGNGHVEPPVRRIVQDDGRDDEFRTLRREMAEFREHVNTRFVDVFVAIGKASHDIEKLIAALGGA